MPHLMNCPHSEAGWCLACVKQEHEKHERLTTACANLVRTSHRMMRPFSERGAKDVGVQASADQWGAAWAEMRTALAELGVELPKV